MIQLLGGLIIYAGLLLTLAFGIWVVTGQVKWAALVKSWRQRRSKAIILCGLLAFVLCGSFPPWLHTIDSSNPDHGSHSQRDAGYSFILTPPDPINVRSPRFGIQLDIGRLAVEWLCVLAATAGLWVTLVPRKLDAGPSASWAGNVEPVPGRRPLRIVVMDDEPFVGDSLKMMFQFFCPGATVLTFVDAEEALQELEREDPDFFTTDLSHEKLYGDGVLGALAGRGVKYPVFVISGMGPSIETEGLLKGVRDAGLNVAVLSKPVTCEDIQRLLSSCGIKPEGPSARGSV